MTIQTAEIKDPKAVKDILELHEKITLFQQGKLDGEKFRAFRLARGVYGQRQDGYQMIRIKLPFGRLNPEQLVRIADLSEIYGNGNLHATTRQDIQLHYVKLADAPQLWARLEEKDITLREACGNTIRNLTASYMAGIDPEEPVDVSPYASAMFRYFLRNPVCQELGRKFKIAFASSEKDSAFAFIHDLGLIPRIREVNGRQQRGFKVVMGGGLGAQPFLAQEVHEFLEEDQLIPFTEAVIRIFDRYGERVRRHKARLKYLINDLGLEAFLELVEGERKAIRRKVYKVNHDDILPSLPPVVQSEDFAAEPCDQNKYRQWLGLNTFEQKQPGYFGVQIKLPLGDLKPDKARGLASVAQRYASNDIRVTVNQGFLLKFVPQAWLPAIFNALNELELAEPGFDSLHDITACPGTDTCNLGIASSMGLATELERLLQTEFPDLVDDPALRIKISGCMNACGHHTIANIGFHGMSLKEGSYVLPAMQVLLGGGPLGSGRGRLADKVIKLASKKVPEAVRVLLSDYKNSRLTGETFNDYYDRQGKNYFYLLLKPLSILGEITQDHLLDWGTQEQYKTAIGVGECAGALVDMVAIVLEETMERLQKASESYAENEWVDSIYYSYNTYIHAGKALLLMKELPCNTQYSVLNNFEKHFVETGLLDVGGSYKEKVLQINKNEPDEAFAAAYMAGATAFLKKVQETRALWLAEPAGV